MNKLLSFVFVGIFLISLVSAGVSLQNEPESIYNLGDHIGLNLDISPEGYFENLLILKLVCGANEVEIYKEFVITDVEIQKEIKIPLVKGFIGEASGFCRIVKEVGGVKETISDEFKISNKINIYSETISGEINPGETVILNGTAVKENGKKVEGTIEILSSSDSEILKTSSVELGEFSLSLDIPKDFKAGERVLKFYVYEKDKIGNIVNSGNSLETIYIRQVPTNIEIVLDKKEIVPGNSLSAKILLHDQTGEKMNSNVYVAIKNSQNEIVEKIETETDVDFEYKIESNEPPARWSISAYSEDIINNENFIILENKEIFFDLNNETLFVKNIGNVLYNDTINVSVGDKSVELPIYLGVGGEEKYALSAPTGEYDVSVGDIQERVLLTGNAVKVKKLSGINSSFMKIVAWIFIILVLGFMAYVVFKKGYKRSFFGRVRKKKTKKKNDVVELGGEKHVSKKGFLNPSVKTELSLSINGTKQNSVVGCIALKDYEEIKSGEGNVRETFEKISNVIESNKGLIYKNHGHVFFILAPVLTKTFKNEETALNIADEIVKILKNHNKKFKKKIEFGISLNYGTIVTKIGVHKNHFMSMGTLMTDSKKMANASNEEVYLGEKVRERLGNKVRVEVKQIGSLKAYEIKELNSGNKDYSPFLKGFMERQQKERIAKENHKKKEEREKENSKNPEDKKLEDSVEKVVGDEK